MVVNSRFSWRIGIPIAFILAALILSLMATIVIKATSHAAGASLVRISSDPYKNPDSNHKTQVEPDTFAFGNTVVSVFQSGRYFDGGASNIGWATSTDGGATWSYGFLPGTTDKASPKGPYKRVSDPSIAYDPKHNVWVVSYLAFVSTTSPVDVLVSRSTNGGTKWGTPVVVNSSGDFNDKNWTVCDTTVTSPFYGNCYTEFDDFTKLNLVQMSTSTDGGVTWSAPQTTPDHTCVIGGQPLVQPNGTVIVPIDDCLETSVLSFRSTNGGKTWSKSVLAAQILFNGDPGGIRSGPLPSAEIDKSGRVYVIWSDCRFENFCHAPIGTNDLVMISSNDGIHWTLPVRIPTNPVGSGADNFIPGLAVDKKTPSSSAHLGLTYYYYPDSTCTTGTCQLDVGFISSTNGGASWSLAKQLAGPMQLTWLPLTTQGFMVGDYISTSIVPGDNDATPVFEVAKAPTPPPSCSNLSTGAPGQGCNEATYTTPEDLLQIVGGTNAATGGATPAIVSKQQSAGRKTAF